MVSSANENAAGKKLTGGVVGLGVQAESMKVCGGGSALLTARPAPPPPPPRVSFELRRLGLGIGVPCTPANPVPSPKLITPKTNSIFLGFLILPSSLAPLHPLMWLAGGLSVTVSPGRSGTSSGSTGSSHATRAPLPYL
jgi:hypothetical protein